MRIASLFVLLLMASLLCAQEAPSTPPPPPAAAAEPAPPVPSPEAAPAPSAQPAPVLGHPLDPADVATLTGRSSGTAPYAPTYGYYYPPYAGGYPMAAPLFGGSQFSGGPWATPMFSPFAFGRGNLFVFRNGFAPPLFGNAFVGFRPRHHGSGHHH